MFLMEKLLLNLINLFILSAHIIYQTQSNHLFRLISLTQLIAASSSAQRQSMSLRPLRLNKSATFKRYITPVTFYGNHQRKQLNEGFCSNKFNDKYFRCRLSCCCGSVRLIGAKEFFKPFSSSCVTI